MDETSVGTFSLKKRKLENSLIVFEEMFWDSYKVIHYGQDALRILKTNEHWEEVKLKFKNKVIDEFAENAFSSHLDYTENKTDRILMGALYFPEEETFLSKLKNKLFQNWTEKEKTQQNHGPNLLFSLHAD
jgi:hypothetical protein